MVHLRRHACALFAVLHEIRYPVSRHHIRPGGGALYDDPKTHHVPATDYNGVGGGFPITARATPGLGLGLDVVLSDVYKLYH